MKRLLLLFLLIIPFVACQTYQTHVQEARHLIRDGKFKEAQERLKVLADNPSQDQLVYLLDYATALQISGQYSESNKYFQMADKLADIQDYTSLSLESGSFLFGEELVQYKGEDFEIILINAMTAINYLNLGKLDEAMVEVRRLNEKLRRFRLEAKRKFTDNALAIYLSAIIYEANKNWDDAAIAYEQVYQIAPHYSPLREDLIRSNMKAKRWDAVKKWKGLFSDVDEKKDWKDSKLGEVIIIYQQGWGPKKDFRHDNFRYPAMYPIWSQKLSIQPQLLNTNESNQNSKASLDNIELNGSRFRGDETLFSVEKIAIASLQDQYASLIARRIGGAVVKEVVAHQIRQKNELMGDLALIAMYASDRADLRQWSTLPREFKIYRKDVPPGDYQLQIDSGESLQSIKVLPGSKVFINYRTLK